MRKAVILSMIAVLGLTSMVIAARTEQVTKKIEMKDADEVVLRCELGAGEFTISPGDIAEAAIVDITYNPRRVDYFVDSEEKRGKCYIELESEHHSKSNIDTENNIWDIVLSTRYETSVEIDIGACDAAIDLGGIPLKEMTLDIGAASGVIEFSKRNPIRLEELDIDAGASSLEIHDLGNANFDYFNFDGGAGSFDLDLSGKYDGESIVSIDIGLGSADITLPEDVAFRIETEGDNWLSSVDIHNRDIDEVDEDVYESTDFDGADDRIILEISVGLGSVDIYWK
ncbi:MAG: hypothetical protein JSU74_13360 [Candidatus Zixiibacteriota bacterium]|nr:MAG: hypothetical protein JSU74_13360 [candidate division Zixibacteria bacterium]